MISMEEIERDPWSTYPVPKKDLRAILKALNLCIERLEVLEEMLLENLDYFEEYEDFEDGDYGAQEPNREAYIADRIREVMKLKPNSYNGSSQ